MRDMILNASKSYYVGLINKHIANVEIYLNKSTGIGEHSDILASVDKEIAEIGKYDDRLSMILNTLRGNKIMYKQKKKRNPNLSKYDAPLRIQYERGVNAFKGNQYIQTVRNKSAKIVATVSPYNTNTMQHREWQRGYNSAYFRNLEKVKREEARRRSQEVHAVA